MKSNLLVSLLFLVFISIMILAGCAGQVPVPIDVFSATKQRIKSAPGLAGNADYVRLLYEERTWVPHDSLSADPVELGKNAKIPVQHEGVKILGPSKEDALRSLALKIWLIEHAQHTIDIVYYIFSTDLAGQAIFGALCDAVKRGVDVRIMVDSIGSLSPFHDDLMALETCADEAGLMRTADGKATPYRARIQAAVFNALTRSTSWSNRRSHDKLLVVDGAFPDKAVVITGGRNMSLAYYGIRADGSNDDYAYQDLEIVLRPGPQDNFAEPTVGDTSTIYYTLLFLHRGNRLLEPVYHDYDGDIVNVDPYADNREIARQSLDELKRLPRIQRLFNDMQVYMNTGFEDSYVLLAHELANLTNLNVVNDRAENKEDNPNSIMFMLKRFGEQLEDGDAIRVVSPYLFIQRYTDAEGRVVDDGFANLHRWLDEHPKNRIEIITNSVLTSDNFMAQSVIDMDVGPRLLLSPEMQQRWLTGLEESELNPGVMKSSEWQKLINHPQIFIYETGRLDDALLGNGSRHYGKLHAKFLVGGDILFVGTANFDYRSRLYNNEFGFFISNREIQQQLIQVFDELKATSYRWGTPKWLEMRRQVMEKGGIKGWSTRQQRNIFKLLNNLGLIWLI